MRKSYLRMLLAYMKKVYKVENALGRLSDHRVNPTCRTSEYCRKQKGGVQNQINLILSPVSIFSLPQRTLRLLLG